MLNEEKIKIMNSPAERCCFTLAIGCVRENG